jgi:peptidylprolyl isomerase
MKAKKMNLELSYSSGPVVFFVVLLILQACSTKSKIVQPPAYQMHESGIQYQIIRKSGGTLPTANDMIKVHYTLMLEDSTIIDSSYERGEPVSFKLGAGHVIKGWDIAMTLLAEGDEANLKIPPSLGYGDKSMGDIPANSVLLFHVKIIDIVPAPKPFDVSDSNLINETGSGLKYLVVEKGNGRKLQPGMRVKVHYSGFFEDLSLFDSSFDKDQPIELTLGRGMVIKGWEEGLSYLSIGDKARLWIPYQLAYGEQGRGPIPPRSNLIFDLEVVDAIEPIKATPYNVGSKDTLSTESGLKYIIINGGSGDYPIDGSIVTVHYTGYLTDGTLFDSSVERDQPFRFVLGQGQVIQGWDEGIALMRKKARYRFIVPPDMAYGTRGAGPIPPNATLIFDVELLGIE